jgi:RNA polymerase sigma factor (sigma-70 family)
MVESNKELNNNPEKSDTQAELSYIRLLEKACTFSEIFREPLYYDNYAWNKGALEELQDKKVNPEVLSLLLTPENNLKWGEIKRIYEDDPVSTIASLSLAVDRFEQRRWNSESYPPPFTPNEERLMFAGYRFLTELPKVSQTTVLSKFHRRLRNQIVLYNTGLVKKLAYRISRRYNDLAGNVNEVDRYTIDDLLNVGFEGVIEAIDKFDLEENKRFGTYAGFYIKRNIIDEIGENSFIRIPRFMRDRFTRYARYYSELTQKYQKLPTYEEVLKYAKLKGKKIPRKSIITLRKKQLNPIELDKPTSSDHNIIYYDITPSPHNMEREAMKNLIEFYLKENLPENLETLQHTVSIEQYTAFVMKYQIEQYLEEGFTNVLTDVETGIRTGVPTSTASSRHQKAKGKFIKIAQETGLYECL